MNSLIAVTSNRLGPRARSSGAVAAMLLLALPSTALGQHVNSSFWITNGTVFASALSGNTLYIGGDFTYVGPYSGPGVPFSASSGAPLPVFPKVHGGVYVVAPDGAGGWFIGGAFDSVGTLATGNLAHIRSDLTVAAWAPTTNGAVYALAVSGSTVYVGGTFTTVSGQGRSRIAAVDANTGSVKSWNPNADMQVFALAVSGLTVYAGGAFANIGGQTRKRIAALDTLGIATSWNPNANNWVKAIALGDSGVYVGGTFDSIGTRSRRGIAVINPSTGLAKSWDPSAHSQVFTLAVSGSVVYAGGTFDSIGGQPRINIAALNVSNGLATSWNPNANGSVDQLVVNGSTVYACGSFWAIGGQTRYYLAAVDAGTGLATTWNPSVSNPPSALAVNGSSIYVGGSFQSTGGQRRSRIAAIDVTTGAATSWNPNADASVYALAVKDTTIYAGGAFTGIGGQTRFRLAALGAASGLATGWAPLANDVVQALAVTDSAVYAGGWFTSIGGQTRNRIAAISRTTGLATAWNPDANDVVYALTPSVDGSTLYVGGGFTILGGLSRHRIAELATGTGLATPWNPDASAYVYTLQVKGIDVLAGGAFVSIGGQNRLGIAALNVATGLATSWNPIANGVVWALAGSGSIVYAAGDFTSIGDHNRNRLAALDGTSGIAQGWDPNADYVVRTLSLGATDVYAGGTFSTVGGVNARSLAAITALFGISRVEPDHGGNTGPVTVVIRGVGFQSGASPYLRRSGQPDISASQATVGTRGDSIGVTFNLAGKPVGAWDVVVSNPSGTFGVLSGGFTIEPALGPQLRVVILGPPLIRAATRTSFDLVIDNPGNIDATFVPLWLTGVPPGSTVELDYSLNAAPQSGGEPDWSGVPLGFTSPGGFYVPVLIPRVPPGTTVRRVFLTVPALNPPIFKIRAAVAPPWIDGNLIRSCLSGGGVISNPACMGAQLTAINAYLAGSAQIQALSGVGEWAKVAFQCEGAPDRTAAVAKANQILDYMVHPIEVPGSASAACAEVLPPQWRDSLLVTIVSSFDPNDKLGARDTVSGTQAMPYSIRFENDPSIATAPAQQVVISDPLDVTKLDPNTVSLDVITFGNVHVVPPPGLRSYATQVDMRPGRNLLVNVSASVDPFTGILTWYFTSIDPATGLPPTNPLSGFLPPNQTPPEGEGSVLFTIMPRPGLSSGTVIHNGASITFDTNAPHATPTWSNTVDNAPPGSHVLPLAANSDLPSVPVSWTPDGAPQDLRDFTVYVSEDGAPYRVWRLNVAVASDTLVPPGNHLPHTYAFYSVARDVNGNIEVAPGAADATTQSRTAVGDATPLRLALEGARPNPALSTLRVSFTLASREPAWLEVIDIAGRRLIRREVGSLGPGAHSLTLDDSPPLRPGLYFLRLMQGPRVLSARVALIQ
jgi:hypothetical protein